MLPKMIPTNRPVFECFFGSAATRVLEGDGACDEVGFATTVLKVLEESEVVLELVLDEEGVRVTVDAPLPMLITLGKFVGNVIAVGSVTPDGSSITDGRSTAVGSVDGHWMSFMFVMVEEG